MEKLVFNKKSLAYKICKTAGNEPNQQTNICAYCWLVVWSVIWLVTSTVCVLFLLTVATTVAVTLLLVFPYMSIFGDASTPIAFISMFVYALIGIFFLGISREFYKDEEYSDNYAWLFKEIHVRKAKADRKPRNHSLVLEYIKAKKRKVCPIVEFE